METTHKELRKLRMPHGVHKSTKNDTSSRNAAFQACQACYARKKRCVTSPSHHQCTYCFREGQRCLPRERPVRPVQNYTTESPSEPTRPKFDLPLPQGIDHEVPRWSAVYSMFSEALRLLPPEGFHMNDRRKRDISVEREQSPDRKKRRSTSNYPSDADTRAGDVKLEPQESDIMTHETEERASSSDALSSFKAIPPWEEPRSIHPKHAGAGLFFGELDALLRF